ncbi:Pollen receptor-like kinase 2 [Glycine max]|nr:Pollen receptor-like kinase 2 [Glycine max]
MIVMISASDTESLLKFRDSLENNNALLSSWNASIPPCSDDDASSHWPHVQCYKGHVWGLKLESMRLKGVIDVQSLLDLPYLRTISLMNNDFDTAWPEINKVVGLKTIFLSNNKFSGEIPAQAFQGMQWLKKIHLSNNQFTGPIPTSLASIPRLMELRLEGNHFTGPIPNFQHAFKSFSVANNQLKGEIPASLHNMPASSFSGNEGVCGTPLSACSSSKKKSTVIIVVAVVLVIFGLIVIGAVILLVLRRRRRKQAGPEVASAEEAASDKGSRMWMHSSSSSHGKRRFRLSFMRDERDDFDWRDLLKSSARILRSDGYSSSCKAVLLDGTEIVVKKFTQMNNVGRDEFREHMRRIGSFNHPNLLPLVAYYCIEEERVLITDFVPNGSLAARLHGSQPVGQASLDWGSRLKIVKGIAKGLENLYSEMPSLIAAHGNLKSSNVLLSESLEPLLTDYGLLPVINQDSAPKMMFIYKSPEYVQHGRITKKTDVWSLGILILEILTGNFPDNFLQDKGSDQQNLANWVHSQEWTSEMFDKDMMMETNNNNSEGEMIKLLKIALACCEWDEDKRWDLKEAVERIHEVNEEDDNGHDSDGEVTISIE